MLNRYNGVNDAVWNMLDQLLIRGEEVTVRGMATRELRHASFTVVEPMKRCTLLEGRNGNVFAQVAETLWMLSGRNDLDWLELYIPQCKRWSDDGKTWRAAYGPRLRNWVNPVSFATARPVDQLAEVVKKLRQDPMTRQAVISIWDPAQDWIGGSKDYPCNNWLHFMIRDFKLHLNVAVRSNDLILGFSHIDFFGWSVLLQLMAYWVGAQVGEITWNASSLHIYDTHYQKAQEMVDKNAQVVSYLSSFSFVSDVDVDFEQFDTVVSDIFTAENRMRNNKSAVNALYQLELYGPSILSMFEYLMLVYVFYKRFVLPEHNEHMYQVLLTRIESDLPNCDLRQAAVSYITRTFAK